MFTKVIGKECKNGACKLVGIPQDGGLDICKCGTQLTPIEVPDNAKNAIVSAVLVLVALLGGWLAYEWIGLDRAPIVAIKVLLRMMEPPPKRAEIRRHDDLQPPSEQQAFVHWTVESKGDGGMISENTYRDFRQVGTHLYRTDRAYYTGDQFRLKLEHNTKMLYVFHRGPADVQRLAIGNAEPLTVPPGNDGWITLDDRAGTEEFVLVGADKPLPKLESVAETSSRSELDPEFANLENDKSVLVARIEMKHEAKP